MRVLSVIAEMGTGGAESVTADLAAHLAGAGHDVCVASSGGWRADALARDGVATLDLPLATRGAGGLLRAAARLRHAARVRPVDVVHAHNVRASLAAHLGTRWGRRGRPPLVTTVHGLADSDYPRAARVLATSDVVVAVSGDVADRLARAGLDRGRTTVVENAVPPPSSVTDQRAAVRAELGVGGPLVLCVARLAPPKRVDLLLDAWPGVPAATLVVVGDGPDRAALERRAGDRVRFLGTRPDVGRLLAAADLLVLPSDREGLPMAVLEAMAAGVPVVASAVGGLTGLGADTVELVGAGSAAALGAAVRDLLADDARRSTLAARGLRLVEERFSAARMRAEYDAVYAAARKVALAS